MKRLYFVNLAFLALGAPANTAPIMDVSDESTLLQVSVETMVSMKLAADAAKTTTARTAETGAVDDDTIRLDQQHQLDTMYNAVAALVAKQAKSKHTTPNLSHGKMLQEAADPFDALNDAFQNVAKKSEDAVDEAKDKTAEVVDQAKEKTAEVVDQAKEKAAEVVDQAKEKASDLADNLNMSSVTGRLGDMVSGKGADVLKKLGDLKDQFAEKLNSTVGQAMDQLGDLKDKLEDTKDAQVLKVAKSLAKAGDLTEGMAEGVLQNLRTKRTELEALVGELDKVSAEEELATAKEKLDDKLDGMSALLALLNSVAHTDIDLAAATAEEDKSPKDVKAKVDAAKAQLQNALDKSKSAEHSGQIIVDTLKATLAQIDDSIAKLEADAKEEAVDEPNQDDADKAASKDDAKKDSAASIMKSLFSEMTIVRNVIQGTYTPEDGGQEHAVAESDGFAGGDAKSSDNDDDDNDAKTSDNEHATSDDSAAVTEVDDSKAEKSAAFAAAGISTAFLCIAMCCTF